jgi:hypothetical protein
MRERRDRINSVAKCAEELGNALSCLDGSLRFGGCNMSDRHPRNASRRFLWFLNLTESQNSRSCIYIDDNRKMWYLGLYSSGSGDRNGRRIERGE